MVVFFFLAILVSHSSCVANREASSKSEHLQVCKVCKGTDVWSVVLKVTGAPIWWLVWRSGVRYSFSEKLASEFPPWPLSKSHRSGQWAYETFVLQIPSKCCRVNSKLPNQNQRGFSRHSGVTSQPMDLQANCNSLLSAIPWARTLRHLQVLTCFFLCWLHS